MSLPPRKVGSMNSVHGSETLEQLLRRDLEAWILAKAAIAKAKGGPA